MNAPKPGRRVGLTLVVLPLLSGGLLGCGPQKLSKLDYPPGVTPGGQGGPGAGKAMKGPGPGGMPGGIGGVPGGPAGPGMR
jgi:hypothetical protein